MSGDRNLPPFRIGTRGSALALAQAERVVGLVREQAADVATEITVVRTQGDIDQTSSLNVIGGRGVFTSALQEALARNDVDAAVHSAKDLPPAEPPGLIVAAFPEREDPRDVSVSRHGAPLADLPPHPRIGTSSRRRALQVRLLRPDAVVVDLRGNIDTRLRKARETDLDGIVLAAAGVVRMGWGDRVTEWLPLDRFLPAPGQGALAVETRAADARARELVDRIDDPAVALAVRAERAFLRAIGAGCTTPLGAHVRLDGGAWVLRAMYAHDGDDAVWLERVLSDDGLEREAAEAAREIVALAERKVVAAPGGRLAEVRVLVTRAAAQAGPLVAALRAEGAEPVCLPTIRIADPSDPARLATALRAAVDGAFDWIAITSANGAARVAAGLRELGTPAESARRFRIAAVGEATAAALRGEGFEPALVAETATAEGLAEAMVAAGVAGQCVLYPAADLARDALERRLTEAGATVERVEAYRTVPEPAALAALAALRRGEINVVTFASPSSVRSLLAMLNDDQAALRRSRIACVGPVTAAAAREAGLPVDAEATDASVAGLVAAVEAAAAVSAKR